MSAEQRSEAIPAAAFAAAVLLHLALGLSAVAFLTARLERPQLPRLSVQLVSLRESPADGRETPRAPAHAVATTNDNAVARPPESGRMVSPAMTRPLETAQAAVLPEVEYIDARRLTQRPIPVDDVVVPAPDSSAPTGAFRGTLILYIDEEGVVMRIDTEDSNLPPDLEALARRAFNAARFHPGMIGTRAVRTRLRVEVGFDSDPQRAERPMSGARSESSDAAAGKQPQVLADDVDAVPHER